MSQEELLLERWRDLPLQKQQELIDIATQMALQAKSIAIPTRQSSFSEVSSETWQDVRNLSSLSNATAWETALQKLQTPAQPQVLSRLLQSWEDEDNELE
jgi:7-cyano-7-deazaguanine synthase in queuosine biosynthesis